MAKNPPISGFADIKKILDAALEHKGGTYRLPTKGKAVWWRQRAYTFRKLLRQREEARDIMKTGFYETPYDKMAMKISDDDPRTIIIFFPEPEGEFVPADGKELEAPKNEYDDFAAEFSKGLAASSALGLSTETPDGDDSE